MGFIKKYWKYFVIIVWYVLIPLSFIIWLFWFKIESPIIAGQSTYTINTEKMVEPSIRNSLRKMFRSTLDLTYYSVCIKNISSLTNLTTQDTKPRDVILLLKDKGTGNTIKEIPLEGNQRDCFQFKMPDDNVLYFNSIIDIIFNPADPQHVYTDFTFDAAKPVIWERFAASAIFGLTYLSIASLWISLKRARKEYLKNPPLWKLLLAKVLSKWK